MSTMTTVTKLGGTQPSATSTTNIGGSVHEYSIRVPKNGSKKYHVMRFNATTVDFSKWSQVKMERENNMKEYKGIDEEQPKFGAGSEFGRDAREEARRKKLGFVARKYKPDDQPWILKSGGKTGKKFKGVREGGVSENTAYYVFTHAADGAIEAFPLQEWYNFQPIQRYKALSAEEAEVEFGKRNRVINFFSLMLRKRLKGDEELDGEEGAGEDAKGRKGNSKKAKELKISEMDEWMDSSSEDESSDGEKKEKEEDEEEDKKKKKKAVPRKKKPRDTDAEAFEDSDDGDDEGRELDYISSSSESEPEAEKQLQGVEEEKALRKLLTSDESSDDEENKSNKEESNEEEKEQDKDKNKNKEEKEPVDKKKKKKKKKESNSKKKKDEKAKDSSSALSSDSTDSEKDEKKKKKASSSAVKDLSTKDSTASENGSRPASPGPNGSDAKRKLTGTPDISATKKLKLDGSISAGYISGSSDSGITEDAVRRYLMRKPMTTTELLQKFKTKKTGLSSEQLVNIMTQILKKINPVRKTIKGKMYLSIKS